MHAGYKIKAVSTTKKGLFHPACLARVVSWFASVFAIFMGHENGSKQILVKRRHVQGMLDETNPLMDKSWVHNFAGMGRNNFKGSSSHNRKHTCHPYNVYCCPHVAIVFCLQSNTFFLRKVVENLYDMAYQKYY